MKNVWIALMILALPACLAAQQRGRGGGAGAGGRAAQQGAMMNRIALERQIVQRFVEQSSREMGLGAAQRSRFERLLREGNDRRRELSQRGVALRQQLMQAIRDENTSDERFSEILTEIDQLREDEHALWRADQEAVREMFTPRQRALFTARYLRLQEVIQDVVNQRGGGQPGPRLPMDTLPVPAPGPGAVGSIPFGSLSPGPLPD